MRITQSISLSKIQPSFERPALRRWKPAETVSKDWAACLLIGVINYMAAIRKQRMMMVELSGIEPLTSCLQSTRSPN